MDDASIRPLTVWIAVAVKQQQQMLCLFILRCRLGPWTMYSSNRSQCGFSLLWSSVSSKCCASFPAIQILASEVHERCIHRTAHSVDFHCCEAVFQTYVVPLFPPFSLSSEVHGRCMDDILLQALKSKSVCKPSIRPSSVNQSKFWSFCAPKSTRYYAYIIKENLRYFAQVLVLIAKARSFPQKHVHVPGLFNRSSSFQLPVLNHVLLL